MNLVFVGQRQVLSPQIFLFFVKLFDILAELLHKTNTSTDGAAARATGHTHTHTHTLSLACEQTKTEKERHRHINKNTNRPTQLSGQVRIINETNKHTKLVTQ